VGVFVLPPSAAVLETRLRGRSKDTEDQIRRRLDVARTEVGEFAQYEYVVVNDDLDGAVNRMRAIVMAERARIKSMRADAETIIDTFHQRRAADGAHRARRDRRHRRYKAVEVCRGLQKRGHDVQAVMTRSARRFVAPLTFEAITRHPVITSQWRPGMNADIEHIAIADHADLLLVAPCTANILGKFATGSPTTS
jgi:hypothetical protein